MTSTAYIAISSLISNFSASRYEWGARSGPGEFLPTQTPNFDDIVTKAKETKTNRTTSAMT